jgi:hypothetical protein
MLFHVFVPTLSLFKRAKRAYLVFCRTAPKTPLANTAAFYYNRYVDLLPNRRLSGYFSGCFFGRVNDPSLIVHIAPGPGRFFGPVPCA